MAVLTEEQSMLRDSARDWVREKSPVTSLRKVSAIQERRWATTPRPSPTWRRWDGLG